MPISSNSSKGRHSQMPHQILWRCSGKNWHQNHGGQYFFATPCSFCNMVRVMWLYAQSNTVHPELALLFTSSDASALLHKLEEVFVRTSQGSGDDYLSVLTRTIKGREKEALDRLTVVRLAFARYFARCTASNLKGN